VLLDVLIALGLMATFLIIIYQLKVQNIDRVENINNILTRERAMRNFLIA
jgi:type II secretory pathway component PulM